MSSSEALYAMRPKNKLSVTYNRSEALGELTALPRPLAGEEGASGPLPKNSPAVSARLQEHRPGASTGFFSREVIGGGRGQRLGGIMASAEHEPITGVWGQSPQRGPGAEPLVRGSGAKPPEAESILVIGCPTEPANLAPFQKCICISTLGATVMIWEKFMSKSREVS